MGAADPRERHTELRGAGLCLQLHTAGGVEEYNDHNDEGEDDNENIAATDDAGVADPRQDSGSLEVKWYWRHGLQPIYQWLPPNPPQVGWGRLGEGGVGREG